MQDLKARTFDQMSDSLSLPLPVRRKHSWRFALCGLAAAIVTLGLTFRDDVVLAVATWGHIPTYNYCFLVPLITLWLIWDRRRTLAGCEPMPSYWGVGLTALALVLWWMADAALIVEARQLSLIILLQGIALAHLGPRIYRRLAFPLLYLFLMVPSGTPLVGLLESLTTTLSRLILKLSGVPIFVDGHTIEVPTGQYFVAPGCAGLNFVLAALALSVLYAAYTYTHPAKRITCVAAAIAIAILANAIRVFGIIWLAEVTNRHVDIIEDHLLYGWLFFSFVILASMTAGRSFADVKQHQNVTVPPSVPTSALLHPQLPGRFFPRTVLVILGIIFAGQSALAHARLAADTRATIELPRRVGAWRQVAANSRWSPEFPKADATYRMAYEKGAKHVELFIAYYRRQDMQRKATGQENSLNPGDGKVLDLGPRQTLLGGIPLEVAEARVGGLQPVLRWSWYWVAGRQARGTIAARLLGVLGRLRGDSRAAALAVMTAENGQSGQAEAILSDFLMAGGPLNDALSGSTGLPHGAR